MKMAHSASAAATHATRATRLLLAVIGVLAGGCRAAPSAPPIVAVDLIRELDQAMARPEGTIAIVSRDRPALSAPGSSRIIWTLPFPRRARFHAYAAVEGVGTVRFRVGVSDSRVYEPLAAIVVPAGRGWSEVAGDLSAYAGFKWSLFYRPDRVSWRLNLSTDLLDGAATALWGQPQITTDREDAAEFRRRRWGS